MLITYFTEINLLFQKIKQSSVINLAILYNIEFFISNYLIICFGENLDRKRQFGENGVNSGITWHFDDAVNFKIRLFLFYTKNYTDLESCGSYLSFGKMCFNFSRFVYFINNFVISIHRITPGHLFSPLVKN